MTQSEAIKWQMPGWRIEQKYSPGVLIGNWDEDRYKVRTKTTWFIVFRNMS